MDRRTKVLSTKGVPFLLPKEILTRISLLPHRKQAAFPGQNSGFFSANQAVDTVTGKI